MFENSKIARYFVPLVLFIGGVVFIVLGVLNLQRVVTFPEVSAVVSNIEYEYTSMTEHDSEMTQIVTVDYTVDGKQYSEELQYARQNYKEGETVTVRYDPENPSFVTGGTVKTGVVYLAFGVLMTIGGALTLSQLLRGKP